MKKINAIMEMYLGDRGRYDKIPLPDKYWEVLEKAEKCEESLLQEISKNKKLLALFEDVKSALEDCWILEADSRFCEGFRFGVLIGLDVAGS